MNSVKIDDFAKAKPAFDEYHAMITVSSAALEYPPIRSEQIYVWDSHGYDCRGQVRSIYKDDKGFEVVDIFLNFRVGTFLSRFTEMDDE